MGVRSAGVGAGNPGLWYGAQARAFGRAVGAMLNASLLTGAAIEIGWDTSQAGSIATGFLLNSTSGLRGRDNGTAIDMGPGLSAAVDYQFVVVLRASGADFYIRGGAYANWERIWRSSNGNGATQYPAVGEGAVGAFTVKRLAIPEALLTFPALAYDTFTRADGALGNTEAADADGQAATALAWAAQAGTWGVAANAAACSALAGGLGLATVPASSPDVIVEAAVTRALGVAGLVLRYVDALNYLIAYHDGTNCKLDQVVAGVTTNLRTGVAVYAAGALLRVSVRGTVAQLTYNNAIVGATFAVPASSAANHGLYTTDVANSLNAFQVLARGTGGEYAALSRYFLA